MNESERVWVCHRQSKKVRQKNNKVKNKGELKNYLTDKRGIGRAAPGRNVPTSVSHVFICFQYSTDYTKITTRYSLQTL